MDFISETKTNLSSSKWHSTIVEFKKSSEVNEDTLSSLWSQITLELTSGANQSFEHQIEWHSLGKIVTSVWWLNVKLLNSNVQLFSLHGTSISSNSIQSIFILLLHIFLLLDSSLNEVFNQLISSVADAILHVFYHKVCEFVDMTLIANDIKIYSKDNRLKWIFINKLRIIPH